MKLEYVLGAIAAVLIVAFGFFFFDVDQTEEARLPEVTVDGGNMPEFDVETGDVQVGSEEVTLNVPKVDVQSPEEENAEATN